jgi:hypothetical protein
VRPDQSVSGAVGRTRFAGRSGRSVRRTTESRGATLGPPRFAGDGGAVALGSSVQPGLPAAGPHGGRTRCPPSARSPSRDCGPIRCCCASRAHSRGPRPFMQTLAATIASAGAAADRPVGHAPGRWRQTSRIPTEPAPRPNLRPDLFRVPGLTCLDQALHAVVSASSGCPARPRGRAVTWRTTLIGLTVAPTQPGHSDQPARGGPPAIMGVQDVVHRDLPRGDGVDRRRAHVSCGAGTPSWYADYETKTSHLSDLQADPARAPDTYGMKAPARRDRLTPETAACVGRAKDAESARRGFRLSSVWGGMPPCADLIHTRPSEDR